MKKIFSLLLAAMLTLSFAGCTENVPFDPTSGSALSGTESQDPDSNGHNLTYDYASYINGNDAVIPLAAPDQCLYYRNRLISGDTDLTWAYDEIVYAASHLSNPNEDFANVSNVYFSQDITAEELQKVYIAVFCDHPEFWFLRQYDKNGCVLNSSSNRLAYLTYAFNISEIPELDKDLQAAANEITAKVETFTADLDKIAYLSGYMYDNYSIDWPSYNETQHSSAMEMLLEKHGVCVGFAATTTFMLQRWGIPAIMGRGKVSSGVTHCWTIIEKDGLYNYVDNYFMKDKGSGTEHSLASFFCFTDLDVFTREHVTVSNGVLLPGSPVGAGNVVTEDTYSSPSPSPSPEATTAPTASPAV